MAAQPSQPIFRFGCIADVQYADVDDGSDFSGTEQRHYRNSLSIFQRAVEYWNKEWDGADKPLNFIAQLGDVIDGKAKPHFDAACSSIRDVIVSADCKRWIHAVGNHELYNTKNREDYLPYLLSADGLGIIGANGKSYYDFSPAEGWRMILLDPYLFSVLLPPESPLLPAAKQFLKENNPNDTTSYEVDWTAGLEDNQKKYVPFNGTLGEEQHQWLIDTVKKAVAADERIILFSHVPVLVEATQPSTVLWTNTEVLAELKEIAGKHLTAIFAGHDHEGGYAEKDGIYHVTLPSPMLAALDTVAYGVVEVYSDRLELIGSGNVDSRSMKFA